MESIVPSIDYVIEHPTVEDVTGIEYVANNCGSFLAANNKMIYYLCCTVFSKTSFVVRSDNQIVAFLYAMPDAEKKYIWLHQIAVLENRKGLNKQGGFLMKKIIQQALEMGIQRLRFAIRRDNITPVNLIFKLAEKKSMSFEFSLTSLGIEDSINPNSPMEIFELFMSEK